MQWKQPRYVQMQGSEARRAWWRSCPNRMFQDSTFFSLLMRKRCGPFKLAYILNQCLDRYDLPDENLRHQSSSGESSRHSHTSRNGRKGVSQTLHLSQPSESSLTNGEIKPAETSDAIAPAASIPASPISNKPVSSTAQILIVDDNAINRSVSHGFNYEGKRY
jgi:hypothetical protein